LVFFGLGAWAQEQSSPAQAVLLRDVWLIDGTGAKPRDQISLLIPDGRIEKIGKEGMPAPRQAITAATGQNAKLLHLQDRGMIAAGGARRSARSGCEPAGGNSQNTRKIVTVYHDGRSIADLPVNEANESVCFRIKTIGEGKNTGEGI
jgi:hypothetical protein